MKFSKAFFSIQEASIFHLTGRDAARYLNARLSNNVRDLPPLHGLAAAALSPQGRTELFGTILKISAEEFFVICDGGDAIENEKVLLRYKVADRIDCRRRTDLCLMHLLSEDFAPLAGIDAAATHALGEWQPLITPHGVLFPHLRTPRRGFDLLISESGSAQTVSSLKAEHYHEIDIEEQLLFRIQAKRPSFPSELNDQSIFLESGLTHAISFTKGCYVGQEVVEKVDSHGRLPYSLAAFVSLTSAPAPKHEAPVFIAGDTCGTVIDSACDTQSGLSYCFARIKTVAKDATGNKDTTAKFNITETEYQLL